MCRCPVEGQGPTAWPPGRVPRMLMSACRLSGPKISSLLSTFDILSFVSYGVKGGC